METEDGVDGELSELLAIVEEQLGGKGGEGNVLEVLAELLFVGKVVHGDIFENFLGDVAGLAPSLDDDLGVNFVLDKLLGLAEELSGEHGDRGGAVTDLLVLGAGDVDEDARGGVVNVDGLQDGGAIVSHGDLLAGRLASAHGDENLVHALRAEGSLDEVGNSDGSNERLLQSQYG